MPRYWIIVASKDHVLTGIKEGIAQACHGKGSPLKRLKQGDYIIYYSPKIEFNGTAKCQSFTALGKVADDDVYQFQMTPDFCPFRRKIDFLTVKEISILPLISELQCIKNKKSWGAAFRFGMLEIPAEDFALIAERMVGNVSP